MEAVGEIFRKVVELVQSDYYKISGIPETPYYLYGHPIEIIDKLAKKTNAGESFDKFPLICLFTDINEIENVTKNTREITVDIVICNQTKPEYDTMERVVESFNPVLYPIYESLKKNISKGGVFQLDSDISKTDRFFWGKNGIYGNTANIFNDFIDAIEIKDLKLKILKNNCS